MLKNTIQDALNAQMNAEIYSAYLYLSMSAYFESLNLKGFANWMRVQAQEEMMHAMKFYGYIAERGGRVKTAAIEAPPTDWDSPLAVFTHTLKHEQKVTALIHGLVDLAAGEKDHATANFLQWFVGEQVEEEASADGIVQQVKLAGESPHGLLMLDKEYGQRVFQPPQKDKE
jgi:ferritin